MAAAEVASVTTTVSDPLNSAGPSTPHTRADWIQHSFEGFRSDIDSHNDRRERLIKTSRDVTALSKKLIFSLHRCPVPAHFFTPETSPTGPSAIPARLQKDIQGKLDEISTLLLRAGIEEHLSTRDLDSNRYRYERNIGGGLEEFIEGIAFYHFLMYRTLITQEEVQAFLTVTTTTKRQIASFQDPSVQLEIPEGFVFPVPTSRYLLGISDLTGEMMRFATNSLSHASAAATEDPVAVVRVTLELLRDIYEALTPLTPYVQDLSKKQRTTASSLQKCEDLMYQLNIRLGEFTKDIPAGEGQRAVVREMINRALQGGGGGGAGAGADDEE